MPKSRNGLMAGLDQERVAKQHYQDELMKVRADLTSAYADLARANENSSLVTSQMADLRREIQSLREETKARDISIAAQDAEISHLKSELSTAEELLGSTDAGALRDERDALKARLVESERLAEALRIQARNSEQKLSNAEARLSQYQNRVASAEDKARQAQDALRTVQAQYKTLSDEATKYKSRALTLYAEQTTKYDDLLSRYSRLETQYDSARRLLKEAASMGDDLNAEMEEAKATLAQTAQDLMRLEQSVKDEKARAETARLDAERAEREKQSLAARAYKAEEELARVRRERAGKLLYSDFVQMIRVSAPQSEAGLVGLDFVAVLVGETILVQRRADSNGEVPQAARDAWFESVVPNSNGHAHHAPPIPEAPPSKRCSWCDKEYPNDAEHFTLRHVKGGASLSAWCTPCNNLRDRIIDRLDAQEPNWNTIGALLDQALAICPALSDREPYIGYFLDPAHRVGVEPKTRYLFETKRTQIPYPKVHNAAKGRVSISESV